MWKALRKAKKYDWKDTNLALFGSDTEKQVKKESARTERAWAEAGKNVGLQIWRIVNFKVTSWPKEDYGKFYNGDSYIILNTYKEGGSEELLYDVHFWIGRYSSQDEYGTAAYKTVELDTFLDDKPIQHREVQGHESELFENYFDEITILNGGADSGFRHVKPEEYQPRLFHFHGTRKQIQINEVPRCKDRIRSDDVFILDNGLIIYQWNGSESNKDERMKAMQYCIKLKGERSGKAKSEVLDEGSVGKEHEFYTSLTEDDDKDDDDDVGDTTKELYRLSDASGKMKFDKTKSGSISKSDFDSKDVFIFDTKKELFVWIGKHTSPNEKNNAMTYAHNYLNKTKHAEIPVTRVTETGKPVKPFLLSLAA